MTTKQTVPYKDADEAFEAYWDDYAPETRVQDTARSAFLEGWAAHADHVREKNESDTLARTGVWTAR